VKVLIGIALSIAIAVGLNYYLLDGVVDSILAHVVHEDTFYAPGYSDAAFRRVTIGMTEGEVTALLGRPLGTRQLPSGEASWSFTRSPGDHSYRLRAIIFKDGVVRRKIHWLYVD
jgi:hypothetical protein